MPALTQYQMPGAQIERVLVLNLHWNLLKAKKDLWLLYASRTDRALEAISGPGVVEEWSRRGDQGSARDIVAVAAAGLVALAAAHEDDGIVVAGR